MPSKTKFYKFTNFVFLFYFFPLNLFSKETTKTNPCNNYRRGGGTGAGGGLQVIRHGMHVLAAATDGPPEQVQQPNHSPKAFLHIYQLINY